MSPTTSNQPIAASHDAFRVDAASIDDAQQLLARVFGYREFRFGQEQIIGNVLQGQDTMALLPTGAGKSLCYQLPALLLDGVTIVISPLLSLMDDQVAALREVGLSAAAIHSGLSSPEFIDTIGKLNRGEIKVLYLSPERILQ